MNASNTPISPSNLPTALLGGLSPQQFLSEYWQKKPLLIRQAITQFDWLPTLADLTALACQEDVESRLVTYRAQAGWNCISGTFRPAQLKKHTTRPSTAADHWALLVQGVNHHVPFCADLLYRFGFIPHVRLDDLMISWAPPCGGVGAHFDSYDVFLLQVGGKKRWRISSPQNQDLTLVENAPLKILQHFAPEQEWVLEHGDMLYLPPHYAHEGVALDAGMTWSIGFRAPNRQELSGAFLDFLRDHVHDIAADTDRYADADLQATAQPARLPDDFVQRIHTMLNQIKWDETMVRDFVGHYFSEPKAHVWFDAPDAPLSNATFAKAVQKHGVVLDLKSTMLFDDTHFYLNGHRLEIGLGIAIADRALLQQLANQRSLPEGRYPAAVVKSLYEAYCDGYLHSRPST